MSNTPTHDDLPPVVSETIQTTKKRLDIPETATMVDPVIFMVSFVSDPIDPATRIDPSKIKRWLCQNDSYPGRHW